MKRHTDSEIQWEGGGGGGERWEESDFAGGGEPTSRVWAPPTCPYLSSFLRVAIPFPNELYQKRGRPLWGAGAGPARPPGWLKVTPNKFNIPQRESEFPRVWGAGQV